MIPRQPRSVRAFTVSIILHVVIGVVLLRSLEIPSVLLELFSNRGQPVVVERIGFLALPHTAGGPARTAKSGGDNRPDRGRPADVPPPVVAAPSVVPSVVPSAPPAAPKPEGGAGEIVGEGGATRGIRPNYTDPRLWLPPGEVVTAPMRAPRTRSDSLYDMLADKIRILNDSVAAVEGNRRQPGDWTVTDSKGRKYGIDPKFIRLGKFSIPTAILALLPLNAQANPIQLERQRTMNEMTRQIQEQAARYTRDEEFRAAVKALRARKDRERAEAQDKAKATAPPAEPTKKP